MPSTEDIKKERKKEKKEIGIESSTLSTLNFLIGSIPLINS